MMRRAAPILLAIALASTAAQAQEIEPRAADFDIYGIASQYRCGGGV